MIDRTSLKEAILFSIKHYGTKTKGEDFRLEQVAEHLTEKFMMLNDADKALEAHLSNVDAITSFSIKVM